MSQKDPDGFCNVCRPLVEMVPLDPEPVLVGRALDVELADMHVHDSEANVPMAGDIIYYYFIGSGNPTADRTLRDIKKSLVTGSFARCMCLDCLQKSLDTEDPHYGDGAYATFNGNFSPLNLVPDSVRRAHGLRLNKMYYRAKIELRNVDGFIKFSGTGGVIRSILPKGVPVTRWKLYCFPKTDAIVIAVEKWSGAIWVPA